MGWHSLARLSGDLRTGDSFTTDRSIFQMILFFRHGQKNSQH